MGVIDIVFICRDIHGQYAEKVALRYGSPYDRGFKKCGHCDVYIRYEGVFCPCCSARLRDRPKSASSIQTGDPHSSKDGSQDKTQAGNWW